MEKIFIDVFDYSNQILKALKNGILLTTKVDDKVNTMTIAWGKLGIEWNKPIFSVYVRESRHTHKMLQKNPEFTLNIPFNENFDRKILGYCGIKSGRDVDKIEELGLTLVTPEEISVPAIKELPLTLECRITYTQLQDEKAISQDDKIRFYPEAISDDALANKHYHYAYYGEIVQAYIIKD